MGMPCSGQFLCFGPPSRPIRRHAPQQALNNTTRQDEYGPAARTQHALGSSTQDTTSRPPPGHLQRSSSAAPAHQAAADLLGDAALGAVRCAGGGLRRAPTPKLKISRFASSRPASAASLPLADPVPQPTQSHLQHPSRRMQCHDNSSFPQTSTPHRHSDNARQMQR